MSVRMNAYQFLVNRVPAIQKEYWRRRKLHKSPVQRAGDWIALLGMNLAWSVGYRSWAADEWNPDAKRVLPQAAESSLDRKLPPEELAKKLLTYDVISFDIFDTLIFRPFEKPTDLFHMVGAELDYLDFARLRAEAEAMARKRNYQEAKTYEVTLEKIWDVIEEDVGIPKDTGMPVEIAAELNDCFGNPYMLEVFEELRKGMQEKASGTGDSASEAEAPDAPVIICTSDMYLPSDVLRKMLKKAGFAGVSRIYVSCEQGAGKSDGSLYEKIRSELEDGCKRPLTFVHMGDNRVADREKARAAGWEAIHYPNVNDLGEKYRARDLSAITGSLYRGIVNTHIYNGLRVYTREYELGFIYGGLFVTGYCQWIHRYVEEHDIDKILFLARDGDILYKVYRKMYPKEAGPDRTEYVYWSRRAATKMGASYFKYDFFRRFLHHKVNQEYTLEQIFASMELSDMLGGYLKKQNDAGNSPAGNRVSADTKLTSGNRETVEGYLMEHWKEVLDHYKGQRDSAGAYYRKVLTGHRRVAAVDVGWAGSGAVVLQYLARKEWGLDCEIIGLLAGTNSAHNGDERDTAEGLRCLGKQASYLYSQEHNRDLWKFHDAAKGHNLLWELLLSSEEGSLKGFYPPEKSKMQKRCAVKCSGIEAGVEKIGDGYTICLGKENRSEVIGEIQRGIEDFAAEWTRRALLPGTGTGQWEKDGAECLEISGADAYGVVNILEINENIATLKKMFDFEGI